VGPKLKKYPHPAELARGFRFPIQKLRSRQLEQLSGGWEPRQPCGEIVTVAEENWGFFLSAMPADVPAHQKFFAKGRCVWKCQKKFEIYFS